MTDILFIFDGYSDAYFQTKAILPHLAPDCSVRVHETKAQDAMRKYRENSGYDLVVISIEPALMTSSEQGALSDREFIKLLSSGIPVVTVYDSDEGYDLARNIFKSLPRQFTLTTNQIREPSLANAVCRRVNTWMQARHQPSGNILKAVTRPLFRAIEQGGTNIVNFAALQQARRVTPN